MRNEPSSSEASPNKHSRALQPLKQYLETNSHHDQLAKRIKVVEQTTKKNQAKLMNQHKILTLIQQTEQKKKAHLLQKHEDNRRAQLEQTKRVQKVKQQWMNHKDRKAQVFNEMQNLKRQYFDNIKNQSKKLAEIIKKNKQNELSCKKERNNLIRSMELDWKCNLQRFSTRRKEQIQEAKKSQEQISQGQLSCKKTESLKTSLVETSILKKTQHPNNNNKLQKLNFEVKLIYGHKKGRKIPGAKTTRGNVSSRLTS